MSIVFGETLTTAHWVRRAASISAILASKAFTFSGQAESVSLELEGMPSCAFECLKWRRGPKGGRGREIERDREREEWELRRKKG
jgi:hypothetical protein